MNIIHTADLHLSEKAVERWEALEHIIKSASDQCASLLLICGDLFDQNVDAEKLRPKLREMLGLADLRTVILPGNHDYKAYRDGLYFGDKVTVISDSSEPLRLDNFVIWGLPYEKIGGERLVGRLREIGSRMDPNDFNILLYHGELLDAFFSRREMGNEGDQRYMPVRLSYFQSLPLKYVFAGHFHSRYAGWPLPGGGKFIYSGSPVAVTRRELGQRAVNLFKWGDEPVELLLESFHYEELAIELDPFGSENPLKIIEERLKKAHHAAGVILTVRGLFNGAALNLSESDIARGIRELANGRLAAEPKEEFADVRLVLEDDLYKKFLLRLGESDSDPNLKDKAARLAIEAFRVVKACS
ncbi:MAG: metallophosphoesterase [Firmicutes bacterium]|nr:metallophosphoesterase [Bacillota bacterium]